MLLLVQWFPTAVSDVPLQSYLILNRTPHHHCHCPTCVIHLVSIILAVSTIYLLSLTTHFNHDFIYLNLFNDVFITFSCYPLL